MKKPEDVIQELSPIERRVLPFLSEKSVLQLARKSGMDKTSVLRALEFLANKNIVTLSVQKKNVVELGTNGILYKKNGLPERRLLNALYDKNILMLDEAKKTSRLSDNEFKAALGALKKKAFIELKNGKLVLTARKEEVTKKSLEEQFLELLPAEYEKLQPEQLHALKTLHGRKDIIVIGENKEVVFEVTESGMEIIRLAPQAKEELIEQLTPEMLRNDSFKGKRFRRYDIISPVPDISGGKRHFVSQAVDRGRKIWAEMGFREMTGNLTQLGFWNFDALFTAQDHPVREIHDTFYIKGIKGKLPEKVAERVKKAHEQGVGGSRGWQYKWNENEAKRIVLRTHTTALSAQALARLGKNSLKELPVKFFAIGKCFRNDTVDWSHGFEFNQTEGIVVDENANFRHLIGYLKEFARKMGYKKIRFRPHYFPYTEPSLEGDVWNEEKKQWIEVFAAGIFRPEVTEPLLGKPIPVLAWGPGFDRMMMMLYGIKDFREIYKNDLNQLRKIKFWEG